MFVMAKPVYPAGHSKDLHSFAVFRENVGSLAGAEIHITASTFYQLYRERKVLRSCSVDKSRDPGKSGL